MPQASFWEKYLFILYFLTTSLFFIQFVQNAPPVVFDAKDYLLFAQRVVDNNFNIFTTDFDYRTFFYPSFLATNIAISNWLKLGNTLIVFFLFNLFLFHAANFYIYKAAKKYNSNVALMFLFFSSFNLINLSFTNLLLSENVTTLFTAIIFYVLLKKNQANISSLTLGLVNSLNFFTRPATIIISLFTAVYFIKKNWGKNYKIIAIFLIISSLIILISITNTYLTIKKVAILSPNTNNIFSKQVNYGVLYSRLETTIDPNYRWTKMVYHRHGQINEKLEPLDLPLLIWSHLFNMFDRIYLDTYVRNVKEADNLVRFESYLVLSSLIMYLIFFKKKRADKPLVKLIIFLSITTLAIYLPGPGQPRFSVTIFPLFLVMFSIYLKDFLRENLSTKIRYLTLQIILIMLFYNISELTFKSLYIWGSPVFPY